MADVRGLWGLEGGYSLKIFSKKATARGSLDWPEPEHGLLAHFGILVVLRDFDQFRHTFIFWHLCQGKDGLLLHFGVGIVLNGIADGARGFLSGFLREPEKGLAAHVGIRIVFCHVDEIVHALLVLG